jgi:HSP20 family molecular chaperone IbpA
VKFKRAVVLEVDPPATQIAPVEPEVLRWIVQETQLEIARRAYELFQARGGEHGHDWEDWFRAESEVLWPVSVSLAESAQQFSVRVNVLAFNHNELKIGVEPQRIIIFGKKKLSAVETEGRIVEHINWCPEQILKTIDLPCPIATRQALVVLRGGILTFELPKMLGQAQSHAA